ncbi:TonB-dependent receptor [Fodinibius sp. Rm-B-1B1-1]|uniref:SusC/RagA family TonB-linked outer membrane protein n=1 Tax=Fodinibius alkaliphilus TaxID=3140241 RepID=UPI00315A93E9
MKLRYTLRILFILVFVTGYSIAEAQNNTVSGTVTDVETGEVLPGVNISVQGTKAGTSTDRDGQYELTIDDLEGTLVFSFIGYKQKQVPIDGQTTIDVELNPTTISGGDIVVVGYGTQEEATVTGSVSSVQGADLEKTPTANLSNTFAGRTPGIIANSRSGEPGYDGSTLRIRGSATLNNNDPLIVVDGVPSQIGGLDRLDPSNIESVSVLKDASAAIYGSRAANGVILVTTKRGQEGDIQAEYSFNQGFSMPTRVPEMANSAEYATIANEISYYNNPNGGLNQRYTAEEIELFRSGSDPLNYPNTDWLEETLKPVTMQNRHNLAVSGGNENVQYRVSAGFLNQDGLYENGVTNYKQYNVRSNVDAEVNDNLDLGLTLSGRQEDRIYPQSPASSIFRSAYRAYPTVNAYYPENDLPSYGIEGSNPVMMVTDAGGTTKNPSYVLNGKLNGTYELPFVDGIYLDGFLSADKEFNINKSFAKPYTIYQYEEQSGDFNEEIVGGSSPNLTESQDNTSLVTANIKLNFEQEIAGYHNIEGFVGYEQSIYETDNFSATRLNFPTSVLPELSQGGSAAEDASNEGSSYRETRRNYLGRLSYNYQSKYMMELQFRYDGSSIFPEGQRYGFFPSVSAGWRISSEPWFSENVSFVDDLKIRASYGEVGSDRVPAFQYFNNYTLDNRYATGQSIKTSAYLTKLENSNITWEVSRKADIAIEAVLFENLTFETTVFHEKRENILTSRSGSIPQVTGIVNPYDSEPLVPDENIGEVENQGIEGQVQYEGGFSNEFQYTIGGNITYARNKVIFMDEAPNTLDYQSQTGKPLGSQLLYRAIGIFEDEEALENYPHVSGAQPGDLIYEDYDGDGEITADDRVRVDRSDSPEIIYGFNVGANWKNFDLSVLFQGQARVAQYILPESGDVGNFPNYWAENRWRPNDHSGTYPRVTTRASSSISGGNYPSTFWLRNSAFLRLKNVELGYNISPDLLPGVNWRGGRVYISGYNLLTFTPAKGFDPEGSSGSGQFYPQQRIFNVGFSLKF